MSETKISKKELKTQISTALVELTIGLNVLQPSKKTLKHLRKTASELAELLRHDLKKQDKQAEKETIAQKKKAEPKQKKKKKKMTQVEVV
jgi:hypothetical protein